MCSSSSLLPTVFLEKRHEFTAAWIGRHGSGPSGCQQSPLVCGFGRICEIHGHLSNTMFPEILCHESKAFYFIELQ